MILDIFALIVLLILISAGITIVVFLGNYPAKVAREKNHPQVDAILYLSWFGILTLGALWAAALIWAQVKYPESTPTEETAP